MKHLFFAFIFFYSCSSPQNKNAPAPPVHVDSTTTAAKPSDTNSTIKPTNPHLLYPLEKLFIAGDFNGDGKQDTLYQHNHSRLTNTEIDSIPAFEGEDGYFKLQNWLKEQRSDVYLTINQPATDTIHLGAETGLYCLLNLGDLNNDGKDEVAFVVDYADESNINTCSIYSCCNGKWTAVKDFSINENSFTWTTDAKPVFVDIKDYLEKRNGAWYCMDHQKMMVGENPEDSEMKLLTVGKCR